MDLQELEQRVRKFHEKHGYRVDSNEKESEDARRYLAASAESIREVAEALERRSKDLGGNVYRASLTLEETAEWMEALASGVTTDIADAIADRIYLAVGDAVDQGIPLPEIVATVVDSNDTKQKRDPETNHRLRDKGSTYIEPDMEAAIQRGIARRSWNETLQGDTNDLV